MQNSDCIQVILSFLEIENLLRMQVLNKNFYEKHVPSTLKTTNANSKGVLLSWTNLETIKSYFDQSPKLEKIFIGSDHAFRSSAFHEHCDNKGPTLAVCKTMSGHVFGFYSEYPWKTTADPGHQTPVARSFLFKAVDYKTVIKIEQRGDRSDLYFGSSYMVCGNSSVYIRD